jgi:spore germination protein KB
MYKQPFSFFQGWILVISISIGHLFLIPQRLITYSGSDAWIGVMTGYLIILLSGLVTFQLLKNYPNQSIISVLQVVLGKAAGKALGGIVVLALWLLASIELRETSDSFKVFMQVTPIFWLTMLISILLVYVIKKGFTTFIYLCEFFVPIICIVLILLVLLNMNKTNWGALLPLLEQGTTPVIHGIFQQLLFGFQALIVVSILLPRMKLSDSLNRRVIVFGFLFIGGVFTFFVAGLIALSGDKLITIRSFPIFYLARNILIADFLTGFETYSTFTWLTSKYIQLAGLYFAATIGLTEVLGLNHYKPLITPMIITSFSISMIPEDYLETLALITQAQQYLFLPLMLLVPLVYTVHLVRKGQRSITDR